MGVAVGFEGILALARSQRKEQIVHTKVPLAFLPKAPMDNPESAEYYKKHFGVNPQW
jgi:hypothetical protein